MLLLVHVLTPNYRGRKKRKLRSGLSSALPVKSSPNLSADSQEISRPVDPKLKTPSPKTVRKTKIRWPKREELELLVWKTPRSTLALNLGVSDKAIAKRCKRLGIPQPPRGYWTKLRSGV